MVGKQRRLETIRAAKAVLDAEAADPPDPDESGPGGVVRHALAGPAPRGGDGGPPDRAQRGFTDPDTRILPTSDGFI